MLRSIANVRLCCWNILADAYAHRQLRSSPITMSPIEEWNHRFSLIKFRVKVTPTVIEKLEGNLQVSQVIINSHHFA